MELFCYLAFLIGFYYLLYFGVNYKYVTIFFLFQLSELEQRVLEAEGRAEEAEDKVSIINSPSKQIEIG